MHRYKVIGLDFAEELRGLFAIHGDLIRGAAGVCDVRRRMSITEVDDRSTNMKALCHLLQLFHINSITRDVDCVRETISTLTKVLNTIAY